MRSGNIMPLLAILIALFIVSSCTAHKSANAMPTSGTTTSTAAQASGKFVDRGAETSRAIDHGAAPQPSSAKAAIHTWQLSVLKKLQPYMRWPDAAPYWIDSAAPLVRVTIDRQGKVLKTTVVRSSGYESFDAAARKIFKRALILPPPPVELPGDPLTFTMVITFTQ
jgi:protein TonB